MEPQKTLVDRAILKKNNKLIDRLPDLKLYYGATVIMYGTGTKQSPRISLAVQHSHSMLPLWGGSVPGPGTGIPHAMWCGTHTKSPEITHTHMVN